jgi:calcineurin-like phosphoesterase family protein
VEEMDSHLIENWNEVVGPDDEVYYLGDFTLDIKRVKQILPLLNGNIHLIAGNHDLCHSSNRGAGAYRQRYRQAGFASIEESKTFFIDDEEILLCHLPYFHEDDPDTRFPEFKPSDAGSWLIHGHVHDRWKVNGRQINVGVDVWDYFPVAIEEILDIIRDGEQELRY